MESSVFFGMTTAVIFIKEFYFLFECIFFMNFMASFCTVTFWMFSRFRVLKLQFIFILLIKFILWIKNDFEIYPRFLFASFAFMMFTVMSGLSFVSLLMPSFVCIVSSMSFFIMVTFRSFVVVMMSLNKINSLQSFAWGKKSIIYWLFVITLYPLSPLLPWAEWWAEWCSLPPPTISFWCDFFVLSYFFKF